MDDNNENSGAGRSLGGGAAEPLPAGWGNRQGTRRVGRVGDWNNNGPFEVISRSSPGSGSSGGARIRTFRDLAAAGGGGASSAGRPPTGRPATGDDDDDEDDDQPQNFFAGGERSGLSVQNPDSQASRIPGGDMVRDLLRRAAEHGPPVERAGPQRFNGGGYSLGGEEVESTFIPDPNATDPSQEPAIRHLTFWREGFTVEDGELMRYDDPANEEILAEINLGRAPPQILNVLPGQPVELRVDRRIDQDYVRPARTGGFFGSGNRLGAPVPEAGPSSSSSPMPGSFASAPASSSSGSTPAGAQPLTKFEVDQSLPMTSIQVRLADGTRIVCRMNLSHTVGDIRNFINASRPENRAREYTIGTTFPNKTLEDNNATIESAKLQNSVIVQRWV
ncbi:SEP-domain-containing protein [Cylindrobasidium torrendii FP15055 ss-10]|uniref:SEP-domain-containing protein n=1 Tax=Cylindrobasidium torrendii FP15055 ss-10 TaxID=1314674 RepID=A0A0D7BAE8_9AGAR|nr:SEP-domain-containing protein [Cylindrobasidium torrendii FP15055 ss-10]